MEFAATLFTLRNLFRVLAFSFLLTNLIFWGIEIRTVGFREWLRGSNRQSWLQYFAGMHYDNQFRFVVVWFLAVALALITTGLASL